MNLLYNKNYIHLFFISLLAIHYVVPLIVIGQVVVNPHDNLSFDRTINFPPRGIGKTSIDKIKDYIERNNLNYLNLISFIN